MRAFIPGKRLSLGSAMVKNYCSQRQPSNQPLGEQAQMAFLGPFSHQEVYRFFALYTIFGGHISPEADPQNMIKMICLDVLRIISQYLVPLLKMHLLFFGSSRMGDSSKLKIFSGGTPSTTLAKLAKKLCTFSLDTLDLLSGLVFLSENCQCFFRKLITNHLVGRLSLNAVVSPSYPSIA